MATNYADLRKVITGEIIVKCKCGDEIRRIPINQTPTYDELCVMMHRLFVHKISDIENIVLRYTDEEGDLIVLSDDMDIVHAISQSRLLKVTVFDKERHPIPRDSWDLRSQLNPTFVSLDNVQRDLFAMRDTINDLLSQLGQNRQQDETRDAEVGKPSYKQLSTTDMAEFLEESQAKRKDSLKASTDALSPNKSPPSTQRQSSYSYPQPVSSTSVKPASNTNSYQYYSPYQQQQTPLSQPYPQIQPQTQQQPQGQPQQQQQQPQQVGTAKPISQPGYPSGPVYRPQSFSNGASAPLPGAYSQPPHQTSTPGVDPNYQQVRPQQVGPPQTPNSHMQQPPPSTPTYSQQQAAPRPPYPYPDNARWR